MLLNMFTAFLNHHADFAELNAPPVINYGVVYPQAILIFVITLLYSVSQPLILIFGAIYFGVAYIVYKYRLLFGERHSCFLRQRHIELRRSVLQALRVSRPSVANHIFSPHLGHRHFPYIHDWKFCSHALVHPLVVAGAINHWDSSVGVVHRPSFPTP